MNNQSAAGIWAAMLLAGHAAASTQLQYHFEQIPTFDEPNRETLGLAFAINEFGEVVGISEDVALVARGFHYRDGVLSEVPGFDPGTTSDVRAINQFGDTTGGAGKRVVFRGQRAIVTMPFARRDAAPLEILLEPDEVADAVGGMGFAINDAGITVVESNGSWIHFPDGRRIRWGFPGVEGGSTTTGAINNRGLVVGAGFHPESGRFEALAFNAHTREVTRLHDPSVANGSVALDINNNDVAVGYWSLAVNNRTVPVQWRNGKARRLPFLNEAQSWIGRAFAINDLGDILGGSEDGSGGRVHWILFAGANQPVALTDLVDNEFFERFDDFVASDLNNAREVAGAAILTDPEAPLGSSNKPGILKPRSPVPPARPAAGLWADPTRPGAGVEINRVGDRHYLVWYTYDAAGLPTWYFSDSIVLQRDGWRADLFEFGRDSTGTVARKLAGRVVLSNRSETTALFSWRLGRGGGSEALSYLAGPCGAGSGPRTGTWYDPAEAGFGISFQQTAGGLAGVFYFYDTQGRPRWAFVDFPGPSTATDGWVFLDGACPGCAHRTPRRETLGSAAIEPAPGGLELRVDLAGEGALGDLRWTSTSRMIRLSSEASCSR